MAKAIEEKYQALSEIDHVLKKSGMWIGSKAVTTKNFFVFDNEHMVEKELEYVPGLLKIIDEIISNSVDEYRRPDNLGLTEIKVQMIGSKTIRVRDNGGIPVVMHKDAKMYVPEFLFGQLRTSSNYDDNDNRTGVGTNGVGSALTNILSTRFKVTTADKKRQCVVEWHNNSKEKSEPQITKCKDHFTEIEFEPDFTRFDGIDKIPFDFSHILRKRCIDAAAGTLGLKVTFEMLTSDEQVLTSEEFVFDSFVDYIKMYDGIINAKEIIYDSIPDKWEFAIVPDSNIHVGFVNGAECSQGTHIRLLEWWVENIVTDCLKKEHKLEIAKNVINRHYSIFVKLNVINPEYDSQTKETLCTNDYHFDKSGTYHKVTDKFVNDVKNSSLIADLISWYNQKENVENQKALRKMNKELKNRKQIDKLVEANSKDRSKCELWLFEGDSASSGFRVGRDPQYQASYKFRGVVKNTFGKTQKQIFSNKEFSDLIAAIGLTFGGNDVKKLRYGSIYICTDMDVDGDKIASLLLAFFFDHFPELIEAGMVYRVLAPIIIATKGSQSYRFFTLEEYHKHEKKLSGFHIKYVKGHGGLSANDYKSMLHNKNLYQFTIDSQSGELLTTWFSGSSSGRKALIMTTD